jgi:hypothetical protein
MITPMPTVINPQILTQILTALYDGRCEGGSGGGLDARLHAG